MFAKRLAGPTARRTFSSRSVFALAALGALLLSTALLSASADTPATESSNLDVVYDSGTARLSLNAHWLQPMPLSQTPMWAILIRHCLTGVMLRQPPESLTAALVLSQAVTPIPRLAFTLSW